jgi:hypothetical protein
MIGFLKSLIRSSKQGAQRNARSLRYTQLELERLEDRQLMAVIAYHGGPIIDKPHYESFFLGSQWGSTAAPSGTPQVAGALNAFMNTLVRGKYVDLLHQYNINPGGPSTNPGTYGGFGALLGNPSSNTVSDQEVQAFLDSAYRQGDMGGYLTSETLFMVFTDVNLTVQDSSGHLSQGYHNYFHSSANGGHTIYYAVVPYQTNNQNLTGLTDFQRITLKASQEFVDGVTDPTLQGFGINAQSGWWRDSYHGPVGAGDFDTVSNQQYGQFNGYVVTRVLNNATGKTMLPSGGATISHDNPAQDSPFVATALGRIAATNSLEESFAIDANGRTWYQRQQEQIDPNGRPILTWGPWMALGEKNGFGFDVKQLVVQEFDGATATHLADNKDYDALWVFAKDKAGHIKYIESDPNGNFGEVWTGVGGVYGANVSAEFFAAGQKVWVDDNQQVWHDLEVFAISGGQVFSILRYPAITADRTAELGFEGYAWHPLLANGNPGPVVTLASSNMGRTLGYAQTLVAVGNDGSVWTISQLNRGDGDINNFADDQWAQWQSLGRAGAGAYAAPAVALRSDGFLEIFFVDQKGLVWYTRQNADYMWQTWQSFPDITAAPMSQVTAMMDNYGLELFVLDPAGSLWTIQQTWGTDDFSDSKWFQLGGNFSLNGFSTFSVCFDLHLHMEFLGIDGSNVDWATQVYGSRAWN